MWLGAHGYRGTDSLKPSIGGTSGLSALVLLFVATAAAEAGLRLERIESGLPSEGQWRNGFDVVDIDGDGLLDLLHGPPRKGRRPPALFRGVGGGRFSSASVPRFAELPYDYGDAAAADFNGDGRVDVAFAVHLSGVAALLADPEGDFTEVVPGLELGPPGESEFSSRSLHAADWDGDGRVDLVALGEGPARGLRQGRRGLAVFLNPTQGAWQRLRGPEDRAFGDSLALGDVDGDGRIDAIVGSRRLDDRSPFRLQRDGGTWEIGGLDVLRARSYFPAVAVTGREGDRVVEFAVSWVEESGGAWRSGVDRIRRSADGWQRTELISEDGALEIRALAAGDLDGDGQSELVTGNDRGEIRLFRGQPGGGLRAVKHGALARAGQSCAAHHARLVDLDGDGQLELVLAFAAEPKEGVCASGGSLQVWRVPP